MRERLLNLLREIHPDENFVASENFIQDGLLDSFDVVLLVALIEKEFSIVIPGQMVLSESFTNLGDLIVLIERIMQNEL
jgi:acyl carrier protein